VVPYAYGQHKNLLTQFVYILYGCGKQFAGIQDMPLRGQGRPGALQACLQTPLREISGMLPAERLLTYCPVTVCDPDNANQIFEPNLANLRGKTTGVKL
jgi:hypothetical protein